MCPFCLATMGLVVASATSAGGLAALAVKFSRNRDKLKEIPNPNDSNENTSSNEKSGADVNTHS
jgi:hypothetical protein